MTICLLEVLSVHPIERLIERTENMMSLFMLSISINLL